MVTGASVLGIQCVDGVVLGCDTLASYGSLARFQRVRRIVQPGADWVLAGGGEYSDLQEVTRLLETMVTREYCQEDGVVRAPRAVHRYLARVMYQRRSRLDPLFNSLVLAGRGRFLGVVDMYGTAFESHVVATGFGSLLALPLLRKAWRPDMRMEEGAACVEHCLRVLFYRDCRALSSVQLARVPDEGAIEVSEPYELGGLQWQVAQTVP